MSICVACNNCIYNCNFFSLQGQESQTLLKSTTSQSPLTKKKSRHNKCVCVSVLFVVVCVCGLLAAGIAVPLILLKSTDRDEKPLTSVCGSTCM